MLPSILKCPHLLHFKNLFHQNIMNINPMLVLAHQIYANYPIVLLKILNKFELILLQYVIALLTTFLPQPGMKLGNTDFE